jgi:hypothetical protein
MNRILAKRYAFCDFSSIAGFPNPVPTINEWGDYLPRFRGSKYDHPGEHLFNFHECMLEHGFVHEDVLIKLFKFSLEGNAREWCQSLPAVSIHSLKDFHVAFNSYYEKIYSADLLFPECCHEEEIVPVENLKSEEDSLQFPDLQGLSDLQLKHESLDPNNREDPNPGVESAAHVMSNSHFLNLQEKIDHTTYEDVEQSDISASDSFRSAVVNGNSLQFPDLQGLSNLQLEQQNHDPGCVDVAAADVDGSPHLPDLQKKTDLKQSTFSNEFCGENEERLQHSRVEQQLPEVFHSDFDDPIAVYLDFMSSINPRIFLLEEDYLYHVFKPVFCMIWFSLLFESRYIMMTVNQFLTWLHWKFSVT